MPSHWNIPYSEYPLADIPPCGYDLTNPCGEAPVAPTPHTRTGEYPLADIPPCGYVWDMIIAIINTKGGVAKTTTTIYTGACLAEFGSVRVLDADPQGSATDWAERCRESDAPLPFPVEVANRNVLKRLTPSTDYTVIDTPPGDPSLIDLALRTADVAVVPTSPSPVDVARVWETLEVAATVLPTYVLFTLVDRRANDLRDARSALEREGVGLFDNDIPYRKAVRNALGTTPGPRMHNYDAYVRELLEVL